MFACNRTNLLFPLARHLWPLLAAASLLALNACTYVSQGVLVAPDRHASLALQDNFGDSAERVIYPPQNWSAADSLWFYTTTQGSNLIPYSLFLHLETADSQALFRSDSHMNWLRYLPQASSFSNPDGLPVGWVKNTYQGEDYVGLTCAACHTGQINYKGTAIRVDGAPPLADMELMLTSLAAALEASYRDPQKLARLAENLGEHNSEQERAQLRSSLVSWHQQLQAYNQSNAPYNAKAPGDQLVHYGYGRLDAFGRIYNRILAHLTPGQANSNPANAPVSYPQLWDTPLHDFVQWNGVGDNAQAGPLGRNTGEVLGVFASFDLQRKPRDLGYRSSVKLRNLAHMETRLEKLWSPRWEDLAKAQILPAIDQALTDRGRQVYLDYQCHTCHADIDRSDRQRRITAQFASLPLIGTDPQMAQNALLYAGKSGYFEGEPIKPLGQTPRFGATTPVLPALSKATAGVIAEADHSKHFLRRWGEKIYDIFSSIGDNPIQKTERHVDFDIIDKDKPAGLAAYKARPLNGIWATAPYLHNGSVPSLYELFMPSCSDADIALGKTCRPNRFTLGARELDPVKVGYVTRDPVQYPGLFVFDTHLPGNANSGHEYAAGITPVMRLDNRGRPTRDAQGKLQLYTLPPIDDAQRWALVEYLKTL